MQLLIDAFIAQGWASKFEKFEKLYEKYRGELEELTKDMDHVPTLLDSKAALALTKNVMSAEATVDVPRDSDKAALLGGSERS